MWIDLLKAFAVGICASAPIGPVLIFVMQKSLSNGMWPAFIAGLGAAVVDTLYAVISLFALSFIQSFLSRHEIFIMVAGGFVVAFIGFRMILKKQVCTVDANGVLVRGRAKTSDFFKVLGMSLANPGAFALMLAVVALFRLDFASSAAPALLLVLCVLSGGVVFWFSFSSFVGLFRKAIRENQLKWLTRVSGSAIVIFGLLLIARGIQLIAV